MPERPPNGAGQDKRFQSVAQSKTIVDVNPIPKSYHNHIYAHRKDRAQPAAG